MNHSHGEERLGRLDLNLFRVFDAISRERSLTGAAAALCLTPSAVSHALARLRERLGDPLFTRQGRGVVPTPAAVRLAPTVREALGLLDQALAPGGDFDPRRDVGRVSVALPDELEALLVPALVARLLEAAPQATLSAVRLDRTRLREDLFAGRFDVALDVAQPTDDDVVHERVFEDSFCVVAAARRRRLDREAYLAARHVAVSSRRTGPALEDFRFGAEGVRRRVAVRCLRYETACRIAAASDLLLTLPRRLAEVHRFPLDVTVLEPPIPIPPLEVHLYWHRRSDESLASRWIRSEVRSVLASPSRAAEAGPTGRSRARARRRRGERGR